MENIVSFLKKLNSLVIKDDSLTINNSIDEALNIRYEDSSKLNLDHIFQDKAYDLVLVSYNFCTKIDTNFHQTIKQYNPNSITIMALDDQNIETLKVAINYDVDAFIKNPIELNELYLTIKKLETKIKSNQQNIQNMEQLNLLQQYQELSNMATIISKTDTKGIITFANDNFCRISGYSKEELIGSKHNIIKHPDNKKEFYKHIWKTISKDKQPWEGVIKNLTKDNEPYYVRSMIKPILDTHGNIVEYISIRKHLNPNANDKQSLLDKIEAKYLSLLILVQIEDFNTLQNLYNTTTLNKIEHKFGDNLLSYLPQEYIFENVFSLGNGEFALLTDFERFMDSDIVIKDYIQRFLENIKTSKQYIDDIEIDLNAILSYSFGKYMLYQDAKIGLNESIEKKLTICHSNDFSIKVQRDAKNAFDVMKTVKVALDNYKVVSYFQPIIDNKTKQIAKYESLVRIIDEKENILTPYNFLNVSKKLVYYNQITHRVLENSFKILEKINTKISINLSVTDLEKEETVDLIYKLLEEYKQYTNKIVFEILEDACIQNYLHIKSFVRYVKSLGVQIAIDDFGTGYSNFERLMKFEPDILKIDGVLIKNVLNDPSCKNAVETIVKFAKKENIITIAEYVESEEIFNYLNDIGVDFSQGYYFGKPQNLKL